MPQKKKKKKIKKKYMKREYKNENRMDLNKIETMSFNTKYKIKIENKLQKNNCRKLKKKNKIQSILTILRIR